MKDKKYLYCKKCKKFPDRITEKYTQPLEEGRTWDGDCYALDDSNLSILSTGGNYESYCTECGNELIEK